MDISYLNDEELHKELLVLNGKERNLTCLILVFLNEIDRRKLFSTYACQSLFDYCLKYLNYSESQAMTRIQASRLLQSLPESKKHFSNGDLNLTNGAIIYRFLKTENIKDQERKLEILKLGINRSKRECERELRKISVNKKEFFHFIGVRETTLEMFNSLKKECLKSKLVDDDYVVSYALSYYFNKKEEFYEKKELKDQSFKARCAPKKVRDALLQKKQNCEVCGSIFLLEIDHRVPYALGGESKQENLRVLCRNCNQRKAIEAKLNKNTTRRHIPN